MAIRKGNSQNNTINGTNDNDQIYGKGGNDYLKGLEGDDLLKGGTGHDKLKGGDGDDTLDGGSGNDKLYGGKGDDFLKSGSGNDKLYFGFDSGRDTVKDFEDNVDTLYIEKDLFRNIEDLSGGDVTFANMTVEDMLSYFGSSSGGDSAIDLSGGNGDSGQRIILLGVDNAFDLADDIQFI